MNNKSAMLKRLESEKRNILNRKIERFFAIGSIWYLLTAIFLKMGNVWMVC
jgi:hypothetical protein